MGVASDVVDVVVDCTCSSPWTGLAAEPSRPANRSVSRLSEGLPVVGIVSRELVDAGGVGSPLSGLIFNGATFGLSGSIGT